MNRPQIKAGYSRTIDRDSIFYYKGKRLLVRWEVLFSKLLNEETLAKKDVQLLLKATNKYLRSEPNMLYLHDPVTIVGDIHGQFYDLKEIFRLGENPGTMTKYLFLGDYVDRGNYSLEVIFVLYALKVRYPNEVFLLRGNHECKLMTLSHNFRTDCLKYYDQEIYSMMLESFKNLPISCIINGKYLAVHGGLSPQIESILQINEINRFSEPPKDGMLCDLLWADPTFEERGIMKKRYEANESRGCSFYFGYEATLNFLRKNQLLTIIRAHEVHSEGYRAYHWGNSIFPVLITVFSAPNYCGHHGNKGSILKLCGNEVQIMQYWCTGKKELSMDFPDAFIATHKVLQDSITEICNHVQRKIIKKLGNSNEEQIDPIIQREFDNLFPRIKSRIKFRVNENDGNPSNIRPLNVGDRRSKPRNSEKRPYSQIPNRPKESSFGKGLSSSHHSLSTSNLHKNNSALSTRSHSYTRKPISVTSHSSQSGFGYNSMVYTSNRSGDFSGAQLSNSSIHTNRPYTVRANNSMVRVSSNRSGGERNYGTISNTSYVLNQGVKSPIIRRS